MAYANQAQVLYCLGLSAVDTDYFTEANITLAGGEADEWIEDTYSSAEAARKVRGAGHYAAYVLLRNRASGKTKGVTHTGLGGSPGVQPDNRNPNWHLRQAYNIMQGKALTDASMFTSYEPNTSGSW